MSTPETQDQHSLSVGRAFPWHELCVKDVDAAIDFYTNALGFGTESMDMGELGMYRMLTRHGVPVAGTMSTDSEPMQEIPPHWAVYFAVDDLDGSLSNCVEHGATVVVPAMDVPTVGRMSLISDPQGAHIWLYQASTAD
jgi:uncharacterized protein